MTTKYLCDVHETLNKEHHEISKAVFSRSYLSQCSSYLCYLESSGNEPTRNVLLNLWGKLHQQADIYESLAGREHAANLQRRYQQSAVLMQDLADSTEREFKRLSTQKALKPSLSAFAV
jgi:hypothetical protein